jgi:hypothetical protein
VTAAVRIDRLSLRAGSLSEAQARRLAELVGLALGRAPMLDAGSAPRNVSVSVPAQDGRTVEQLAEAVVHAIEAALRVDGAAT